MANQRECDGRHEVYVRSARVAKDWYADLLGLRTVDYEPGWTGFVLAEASGTRELMLIQTDRPAPKGHTARGCLTWHVGGLQAFWELYDRIKARGLPIERFGDRGDALALSLRDPDGNTVELYARVHACRYQSQTGRTVSAELETVGLAVGVAKAFGVAALPVHAAA